MGGWGAARRRRDAKTLSQWREQAVHAREHGRAGAHTWQHCGGRACGSRRTSLRHGQELLVPGPRQRAGPNWARAEQLIDKSIERE